MPKKITQHKGVIYGYGIIRDGLDIGQFQHSKIAKRLEEISSKYSVSCSWTAWRMSFGIRGIEKDLVFEHSVMGYYVQGRPDTFEWVMKYLDRIESALASNDMREIFRLTSSYYGDNDLEGFALIGWGPLGMEREFGGWVAELERRGRGFLSSKKRKKEEC